MDGSGGPRRRLVTDMIGFFVRREAPSCAAAPPRRRPAQLHPQARGAGARGVQRASCKRAERRSHLEDDRRSAKRGGSGQRAGPRAPPRAPRRVPRLYLRDVAKRSLVREQAYALRLRERGRGARAAWWVCAAAAGPHTTSHYRHNENPGTPDTHSTWYSAGMRTPQERRPSTASS